MTSLSKVNDIGPASFDQEAIAPKPLAMLLSIYSPLHSSRDIVKGFASALTCHVLQSHADEKPQ